MAKMYKKSELKFDSGYVLTMDDEVVALPPKVAEQLNEMETEIQKIAYLNAQPKAQPMPSLDGFERESIVKHAHVEVETKHLDREERRCRGVLEDLRNLAAAGEANEKLAKYDEAIRFLSEDKFVEGTEVVMVDAPTIGHILTADAGKVIDLLLGKETIKE